MNDNSCDKSETFKRDLKLFVEMLETSIQSSKYGEVGKLDDDPFGPGIIDCVRAI